MLHHLGFPFVSYRLEHADHSLGSVEHPDKSSDWGFEYTNNTALDLMLSGHTGEGFEVFFGICLAIKQDCLYLE